MSGLIWRKDGLYCSHNAAGIIVKRFKKISVRLLNMLGQSLCIYWPMLFIIYLLLGNGYAYIVRVRVKLYYNITCHGVRAKITNRPVHISDCNDIIIFVLLHIITCAPQKCPMRLQRQYLFIFLSWSRKLQLVG